MFEKQFFENAAALAKALGNETRLQLIELLSFGEYCVEDLASTMHISIKSISAHLKVMRQQHLVSFRKQGIRVYYRLYNDEVLTLYQYVKELTQSNTPLTTLIAENSLKINLRELLEKMNSQDDLLIIDVRSKLEYQKGHIPGAINIAVEQFEQWSAQFSPQSEQTIVIYCEGIYCIQAISAMKHLLSHDIELKVYQNGLFEWINAGFDIEASPSKTAIR